MLWYCLHSHLFFLISLLPATSSYVVPTPILPLKLLWPATNGISVTKSLFLSYVASQEHWLILYSWNILFPWLPRTTLWLFLSPSVDKFLSVWCSLFFLSPILKSVVLIFFVLDPLLHTFATQSHLDRWHQLSLYCPLHNLDSSNIFHLLSRC